MFAVVQEMHVAEALVESLGAMLAVAEAEEAEEVQHLQLRKRRATAEITAFGFTLQQQQPRLDGGSSGGMLPCGSRMAAAAVAPAACCDVMSILED